MSEKFNDPPWHPIKDPVALKHLGKLNEELGEAVAAVSRCIIQGVDEKEPITGVVNRSWLENELADVIANIELVCNYLNLDVDRMSNRTKKKQRFLRQWHKDA